MNQNKNKLTNRQKGSLDNLNLELSELEMESISGGIYVPVGLIAYKLCDYDSPRFPPEGCGPYMHH